MSNDVQEIVPVLNDITVEKTVANNRKELIKGLKNLQKKVNLELMLLNQVKVEELSQVDKEQLEQKRVDLFKNLKELELTIYKAKANKNQSSFFKFTPSSEISGNMFNRRERRQMLKR